MRCLHSAHRYFQLSRVPPDRRLCGAGTMLGCSLHHPGHCPRDLSRAWGTWQRRELEEHGGDRMWSGVLCGGEVLPCPLVARWPSELEKATQGGLRGPPAQR